MSGFVKEHRQILEWGWYKDVHTCHLFRHLILKAQWKPTTFRDVALSVGQLLTGRKTLAFETGLTEQQVRTALSNLQKHHEITIKSTSKFSIITVCNYSKYQAVEMTEQPALQPALQPANSPTNNQQSTSNQPAANHMQDYKTTKTQETAFKKERKKEGKKEKKDTPSDEGMRLAGLLRDAVLKWKADARTPDSLTAWANDIDKMINIDKRKPESIEAVLKWLPTDNFWPKNVRSGDKLRIQFDVLESGMNKPQPNRQPEAAKNLGPRLTGWPEGTDERYRPRWGNDEAAWLKAKALNDAHHEEQRKKKNAI